MIAGPAADELEPQIHRRLLRRRNGVIILIVAARLEQLSCWCLQQYGTMLTTLSGRAIICTQQAERHIRHNHSRTNCRKPASEKLRRCKQVTLCVASLRDCH